MIVPTRNSARTLAACLRSVRLQNYPELELIVVDNGSTDSSLEIARHYAARVRHWGPERSAQRNLGWRASTGDIVVFLDSDQVLEPNVIREAVEAVLGQPDVGALVIPELARGTGFLVQCRALEKRLYLGDPDVEAARIFTRSALQAVGGYDESLTAAEDWDLADRVAAAGYGTARVTSFVWHDEGRIRLRTVFGKKRYYGRWLSRYYGSASRPRRRVARIALVRRPDLLLMSPARSAGLVALKLVELAGLLVGAAEAELCAHPVRKLDAGELRRRVRESSVAFVVPSYGEGAGIRPTLASLFEGMAALGLEASPLILSDSSPDNATVDVARAWADRTGATLVVERSRVRRSPKEALNAALDRPEVLEADLVIAANADVVVPAESLTALLSCLLAAPQPIAAVGVAAPDPAWSGLRRRAGAWQLRAVCRAASLMPAEAVRAEGALWGARKEFLSEFRFPVGIGSIQDDVELARALSEGGWRVGNAWNALALKVPPGSLRDFAVQTSRSYAATESSRTRQQLAAAAIEGWRDPVGLLLYCWYRTATRLARRWLVPSTSLNEHWERQWSTQRA